MESSCWKTQLTRSWNANQPPQWKPKSPQPWRNWSTKAASLTNSIFFLSFILRNSTNLRPPKNPQRGTCLWPIVFAIGSSTHQLARKLVSILNPLQRTTDFYNVLSVIVMQADITCTAFANYTAWKWRLEKKSHYLAPELTAYCHRQATIPRPLRTRACNICGDWRWRIVATMVARLAETLR